MAPTLDQIAARAYQRFVERGCEHGHDVEDWIAAERELARYQIVLDAPGSNLIEVLRELRDVTGMELRELKDRIDAGRFMVRRAATSGEAEAIRERMQALGAQLTINPT
jgi:large subunit ribosomal protein L7/L12